MKLWTYIDLAPVPYMTCVLLFAEALYTTVANAAVKVAAYSASVAVNLSVPPSNSLKRPVNRFIQPSLPQAAQDVPRQPLFVINNDPSTMTIFTLQNTGVVSTMDSVSNAPRLFANIVAFGAANSGPLVFGTGAISMPQPGVTERLATGDTNGGRSYGVSTAGDPNTHPEILATNTPH